LELGSADEQNLQRKEVLRHGDFRKKSCWWLVWFKKGLRGRFEMYIPPMMEKLGLAEVTHDAKGNKMRAK
jgi:hypothetical protein